MSNRRIGFGLGVSFLALTAAAPALGAVIDYPNGSDNTSPIVLTDNSTQLQVLTGTATQSGVISESGGSFMLGKLGAGTLIFTGANAYTGPTQVDGTLQIGNGSTAGSIAGDIQLFNSSKIVFDRSDTYVYGGSISSAGGGSGQQLEQAGTGTLILTGSAIPLGGTTISAGTLQIGNGGAAGTLTGNVVDNGALVFDNSGTATFSGVISGSGSLTQAGSGTLTLTADNSYAGTTTIASGTLQVGALGFGPTTGTLGLGAVVDNGLLIISHPSTTIANLISGSGGVTISGGSSVITFTAANSYAGVTTIAGSPFIFNTLALSGSGRVGPTSQVIADGRFDISAANSDISIKSLAGAGSVILGARSLTLTAASDTFSGTISGSGGLIVSGGSETLGFGTFGANSFTGQVRIDAGATLALTGPGSIQSASSLVDNGTFDISAATTGTAVNSLSGDGSVVLGASKLVIVSGTGIFSGGITGTGGIIVSGTETLTGNSTYSGVTQILQGGALALSGSGSIASSISIDNQSIFDISGTSSGASIVKLTGPGNVVLGNRTLTLTNSSQNVSGVISGTGGVTIASGSWTLLGANTYTGVTNIGGGATLNVGSGDFFGTAGSIASSSITNSGTINFDRAANINYAGTVSGNGGLVQSGTGTLTLSANNTYTGGTTVSAGTLNITGSIANSAVSVASGAKLTGTGKVGAVTVASGGTLSPGVAGVPGTLTVQGNLALASGANYVDAISPTVTGLTRVSGMASVDGALTVNAASGSYAIGQHYTVLSAVGGLSGTFASVSTSGFGVYQPTVGYDANSVFLTLSVNAVSPFLPAGLGTNGINAAKGIDAAIANGAPLNAGFNALFGLSGAALGTAVTQLSGEAGADAAQGASQAFLPFVSTLMAEGISGSPTMTAANFAPGSVYGQDVAPGPAQLAVGGMRAWGTVYGRHTGIAADAAAGTHSLKAGDVGFAAGIEMQVDDTLRLGAAAGGGHGSFNAGNGGGASDDAMLGVYGSLGVLDQGYVAGAFSYGWHDVDTLRLLTIFGTDLLGAKYTAHDVGVRVEGGWRVALDEDDGLVPYAAFVWDSFQAPAYAEGAVSGTANFALSYTAQDTNFGRSEVGLKAGRNVAVGDGAIALELSAAWAHQLYGAPFALAAFQALSGSSFAVQGGRIATDTALLGAGIDWHDSDALSFGARIDSQLGGGTTALAGTGTISLRW
ncbi:MAG TPA: autotransporter domain-containing protein [Rhizomicrobium sp.]|nr:autotransporter domain-containing protein [Rhizomicrobium sp.]